MSGVIFIIAIFSNFNSGSLPQVCSLHLLNEANTFLVVFSAT